MYNLFGLGNVTASMENHEVVNNTKESTKVDGKLLFSNDYLNCIKQGV